jgi:AraC-like DNA-binding protein
MVPRRCAAPSVDGTLEFTRIAWLGLGRVRAGAHRVVHDPRRFSASGESHAHVVLQVSGASTVGQNERMLTLEPAHFAILMGDRPYSIVSREWTERLVLVIDRERLAADLKWQQRTGRAYSAASGTGRLLFSAATCLADEIYDIRALHAQALAEQLTVLLHVALRNELWVGSPEDKDGRRAQVRRYIGQHLRDPELSVDRIALDLGLSRRTLARIFAGRGETLMEHVYRERLEGIRRELLDPVREGRALIDIARSWGFRNYTHFSDRFRAHFGISPRAVRRRAMIMQGEPTGLSASREREEASD